MRQSTSIFRKRRWRGKTESRWRKSLLDFLQSETPGFAACEDKRTQHRGQCGASDVAYDDLSIYASIYLSARV